MGSPLSTQMIAHGINPHTMDRVKHFNPISMKARTTKSVFNRPGRQTPKITSPKAVDQPASILSPEQIAEMMEVSPMKRKKAGPSSIMPFASKNPVASHSPQSGEI